MLDVLVNNAGVGLSGRVAELRTEDLRDIFEVNVIGAVNCIQASLPHLDPEGRIINVSSVVGKRAIPKVGGYCASKFALNALSDSLRLEVDPGITVTSVYPGTTETAFRTTLGALKTSSADGVLLESVPKRWPKRSSRPQRMVAVTYT